MRVLTLKWKVASRPPVTRSRDWRTAKDSAGPFRGHQAARARMLSTAQMSKVVLQVLLSWLYWDVFEVFSDLPVRSLLDPGKLIV